MALAATSSRSDCQYLILTGHDFNSKRRVSVHFIGEQLADRGHLRWFSAGFSLLSNIRGRDPRLGLENECNKIRNVRGAESYIWRTPVHPINISKTPIAGASGIAFETYLRLCPNVLKLWVMKSDVILIESGLPVLFLSQIFRWKPEANVIYIASDDLDTIECDPYLSYLLRKHAPLFSSIQVPSLLMKTASVSPANTVFIPHGFETKPSHQSSASPYTRRPVGVSVGSMLFDIDFFHLAVSRCPECEFHVIGSGVDRNRLPASVVYHGEMKFASTKPYIENANFGIAPYTSNRAPAYLQDTSMKLIQFSAAGKPAVCPNFAAGNYFGRFSYLPGNADSIEHAIRSALLQGDVKPSTFLTWKDVVDRMLHPADFLDTSISRPDR